MSKSVEMEISIQHINALLREVDIEGFIESGAPLDEYSSEADIIAAALSELDEYGSPVIEAVIAQVWMSSFGLSEADLNPRRAAIQSLVNRIVQSYAASS